MRNCHEAGLSHLGVYIREDLHHKFKVIAAVRGLSLRDLLDELITAYIDSFDDNVQKTIKSLKK